MNLPSDHPEQDGRILRFRRPGQTSRWRRQPVGIPDTGNAQAPVENLEKFERTGDEPDDYRHRQMANIAAFAVLAVLILAGLWLAIKIAELRRDQDCVLAGRRNCAQIQNISAGS